MSWLVKNSQKPLWKTSADLIKTPMTDVFYLMYELIQTFILNVLKGGGVARKIFELRQKMSRGGSNKGVLWIWAQSGHASRSYSGFPEGVSKISMRFSCFLYISNNRFSGMLGADWSKIFAANIINGFQQTRDYQLRVSVRPTRDPKNEIFRAEGHFFRDFF